jgi:hypothetical protein
MCVKRAMNKYCACFTFDFCHCGWYREKQFLAKVEKFRIDCF